MYLAGKCCPHNYIFSFFFRVKVPSGVAQREAFVFGKRFDGKTAKSLGLVDKITSAERLQEEAKDTIEAALGKNSYEPDFFHTMKEDIYMDSVSKDRISKANL